MSYSATDSRYGVSNVRVSYDRQATGMPWDTLSRALYPRSVYEAHRWADMLWTQAGLYTSSIKKAVRYQVADYEIFGDDELDLDDKYTGALQSVFNLVEETCTVLDDLVGWGTSVSSLIEPIVRTITCDCGSNYNLREYLTLLQEQGAMGSLKWAGDTFSGICPNCAKRSRFAIHDAVDKDGYFTCVRWPLRYLDIHKVITSSEYVVQLRLPEYREFVDPIKRFDIEAMCTTPVELIRAAFAGTHFIFDKDAVCCQVLPQPCELQRRIGGWGLPMYLADFSTAMVVLMMDRGCEAVISDQLLPFRLLTPAVPTEAAAGRAQGGPLATLSGGGIAQQLQQLYQNHRMNPTTISTFPIPVQEILIGGDATKLAPIELMEHFEHRLLDSMSIPYTLRSSASAAAAPATSEEISLQLFKQTWAPVRDAGANFAAFALRQIGRAKKWEAVSVELLPQESAIDFQVKGMMMEEANAGSLPKTLAYRRVYNVDWRKMQKRVQQENSWMERQAAENAARAESEGMTQQIMQSPPPGAALVPPEQAAAGGAPAPGQAPMPMGAQTMPMPASIEELMAQAQEMAQQLFTLDYPGRRKALTDLKKSNETLHAQVKAYLDQMTTQAESAGVQAARSGQM